LLKKIFKKHEHFDFENYFKTSIKACEDNFDDILSTIRDKTGFSIDSKLKLVNFLFNDKRNSTIIAHFFEFLK